MNETGKHIKRSVIAAKILNNFEILYNEFLKNNNFKLSLDVCKKKSNVIGKNINLIKNKEIKRAKAIDLGEEGELIVQYENGEIDSIISGEISVRTLEQ
jgi:BirA family biotin operon repressor/biotin-[acetyl-CoA-carboxylase] ligase